jgi:cellulose synthase/poly-beta-1,6-N-acetylglucosamine synthase-like glycosyltransferase
VPALNCAGDVDAFAESMSRQTYPRDRLEVIVADNGSSDETVARLEANGIRCVVRAERGRSRALNAGLNAARGEIICTTDISCRPHPDWVRHVVACFEDPAVGCVAGEIRLLATHANLAVRYQARSNYMSPMYAASRSALPFLPFADGANASFRRAVFEEAGPFDETFFKGADVEICYRMLVATRYKLVFCREAVVEEAGEPTLAALLKQRFRIGAGTHLLEAKYPEFYRRTPRAGGLKRGYWRLLRGSSRLGYAFLGGRNGLEDAMVRTLLSWSQTLGRYYGRWYLRQRRTQPTPVEPGMLRRFVEEMGTLSERVIVR